MKWQFIFHSAATIISFAITGAMTGYVAGASRESVGSSLIAVISGLIAAAGYSFLAEKKHAIDVDEALEKVTSVKGSAKLKLRNLLVNEKGTDVVPVVWIGGLLCFSLAFYYCHQFTHEFYAQKNRKNAEAMVYKSPIFFFKDATKFNGIDEAMRFKFHLVRTRCMQLRMPVDEYNFLMSFLTECVNNGQTPPCEEALKFILPQHFSSPEPMEESYGVLGGN